MTSHHEAVGDLLAVGAMLSWSAYWLASKHARAVSDALEYTVGVTLVAALVMVPIVLLSSQSLSRVKATDWLWISLLAIVPGSAHLIMNWAHPYVDASISSVIGSTIRSWLQWRLSSSSVSRSPLFRSPAVSWGSSPSPSFATRHRQSAQAASAQE